MNISTIGKLLYAAYHPNQAMSRRFPKAAKRGRIRKKWRNRFGRDDVDISNMLYDSDNSLWTYIMSKGTRP